MPVYNTTAGNYWTPNATVPYTYTTTNSGWYNIPGTNTFRWGQPIEIPPLKDFVSELEFDFEPLKEKEKKEEEIDVIDLI